MEHSGALQYRLESNYHACVNAADFIRDRFYDNQMTNIDRDWKSFFGLQRTTSLFNMENSGVIQYRLKSNYRSGADFILLHMLQFRFSYRQLRTK